MTPGLIRERILVSATPLPYTNDGDENSLGMTLQQENESNRRKESAMMTVSARRFVSGLEVVLLHLLLGSATGTIPPLSIVIPDLPWGDINVLAVTDVHSWVGGHVKEDAESADYGHVVSFVEHVKEYAAQNNHDVWFVMNGDWIDGTGLAINGDPSYLIPILERMPFDAITVGNHELYRPTVIDFMTRTAGLTEWFGARYISSNVHHANTKDPLGVHVHILQGSKYNVLTMGFIFNMMGNADIVSVQHVEDTIAEVWFREAVSATQDYHAIMILAHMDVRDPLVHVLLTAIRNLVGTDMPVQFITGHTHKRDYQVLDSSSTSFEAGHYLDTIGFASFPCLKTVKDQLTGGAVVSQSTPASNIATALANATLNATTVTLAPSAAPPPLFQHVFIDAKVPQLMQTLGLSSVDQFNTPHGVELSEFILRVEIELGLEEVIGCTPQPYYWNGTLDGQDSLWGMFRHHVVPFYFNDLRPSALDDHPVAVLMPSHSWRYDLPMAGDVSVGDVIVISPYNNTLYAFHEVPSAVIRALEAQVNAQLPLAVPWWPNCIIATTDGAHEHVIPPSEDEDRLYTLVINGFGLNGTDQALRAVLAANFSHVDIDAAVELPGTTTTSIWLDYFIHNSEKCLKGKKHSTPDKNTAKGHQGGSSSSSDSTHLVWVGTFLVVTLVLGGIVVYQKSDLFHQRVQQCDFATLSAAREYSGDEYDEDNDASEAMSEEDEGKFV